MVDVEGLNLIHTSETVMLGVSVPQADPVQRTKPKTFTKRNLKAVLGALTAGKAEHADALKVLAATGWYGPGWKRSP